MSARRVHDRVSIALERHDLPQGLRVLHAGAPRAGFELSWRPKLLVKPSFIPSVMLVTLPASGKEPSAHEIVVPETVAVLSVPAPVFSGLPPRLAPPGVERSGSALPRASAS